MNRNTIYILAALFVVLIIIAYLITHEGGDRTSSYDIEGTQLFEIDSALVDKIEIENIKQDHKKELLIMKDNLAKSINDNVGDLKGFVQEAVIDVLSDEDEKNKSDD